MWTLSRGRKDPEFNWEACESLLKECLQFFWPEWPCQKSTQLSARYHLPPKSACPSDSQKHDRKHTFYFNFLFHLILVPQPRTKPAPHPLHWKHGVLTPELPGKSQEAHLLEGLIQHWKPPLSCAPAQSLSRVQLFVTPTDWSPQGSSVHGISQARILERIAIYSSRGSSWIESRSPALTGRFFFTTEPPGKHSCYPNLTYYYLLWPHLPQIICHTAAWVTFPETIPTKLFLIQFFTGSSYNFENQFMIGFHLHLQPQLLALSHRYFFTSALQNESKMLKHTYCHISLQTLFFCLGFSSSSWFIQLLLKSSKPQCPNITWIALLLFSPH